MVTSPDSQTTWPPISVVVPTRDRPESMLLAAEAILSNDYPEFELVVVDQSRDESTAKALAELPDSDCIRRIRGMPLGVAVARNLGVAEASYDLIAMTDDDCRHPKDWLRQLARAFAEVPECSTVFGNVVPAEFDSDLGFVPAYVRDQAFIARSLADKPQTEGLSACMGLRREVWLEIGGFDERFGTGAPMGAGAEIDYVVRVLEIGRVIYETPEVSLIHDGFRNWEDTQKLVARYWWGAGAVYGKHFRRHPIQIGRVLLQMGRAHGGSGSRVSASLGENSFLARRLVYFGGGFARGLFLSTRPNEAAIEASELTLICPHLGDGGVQRVVTTLANAWNARGRKVTVVALYRHELLYSLDPGVRLITVPDWSGAGPLLRTLEAIRLVHERLRSKVSALWSAWFPAGEGELPWPFRAIEVLQAFIGGHLRTIMGAVIGRERFRGAWKLHLPTYLRVLGLRKVIRHVGAHNVISFCGSTNVAAVLACDGLTNHLVISERNDPARQKLRFPWNGLRPIFYDNAEVVTANTLGALETMAAYVAPERLAHVRNPLDPSRPPRAEPVARLNGQRLLILGRLHPQKDHSVLLRALASLPSDLDSWRLSIVGQGELEDDLRRQAQQLGVAARVDWHGQVKDPYPYYEAANIFVLPSLHEGSPNALIEAMSCGLPVIVSDASPGPLELVTNEVNGLVFPASNVPALVAAIERLARSQDLCQRLGAEARQLAARHEVPEVLARWEELLESDIDAV